MDASNEHSFPGVAPIAKQRPAFRKLRVLKRVFLRKVLHADDPPDRIARGVAAGFFATAMPIPAFQIAVSVAGAILVNGNRFISIFPQLLNNPFTILPIIYFEFWLGSKLWPFKAGRDEEVTAAVKDAFETFSISAPIDSVGHVFHAFAGLRWESLGPLLLGFVVLGFSLALISYPITVIAIWSWRKSRGKIDPRLAKRRGVPEAHDSAEIAQNMALLRTAMEIDKHPSTPLNQNESLRYLLPGPAPMHAYSAQLLTDGGQAFPVMIEALNAARESIRLESYILRADQTGQMFSAALCQAAQRGVNVRLTYDAIGGMGLPETYILPLLEAGVLVSVYHPLRLTRPPWAMNRRDHRKILVVDNRVSFTGGLNIADDYSPKDVGGKGWRDTHVRLEGVEPALALAKLFDETWEHSKQLGDVRQSGKIHVKRMAHTIRSLSSSVSQRLNALVQRWEQASAPKPSAEGVPLQVLGNSEFKDRRGIRKAYLKAIRQAERYILIENAYFIPDRGFRRALYHALKRGVFVGVVVTRNSDVELAALASRHLYGELLQNGVRIFEWPDGMLHAKTAVIDDEWSVVGSYNLDHRSFMYSLEAVVILSDRNFALRLRNQGLEDMAKCHEVTWQEYESRPWTQNLKESSAYILRYWL